MTFLSYIDSKLCVSFIILFNPLEMSSVLEHYNPYTTDSNLAWDGLKSSKFGRTRIHFPPKDLISHGITHKIM